MCYPMYFLCTCVIEYPKENVEDKIKSNEKNKEKIHSWVVIIYLLRANLFNAT